MIAVHFICSECNMCYGAVTVYMVYVRLWLFEIDFVKMGTSCME